MGWSKRFIKIIGDDLVNKFFKDNKAVLLHGKDILRSDVFIAKYDTDGNYLWAKIISGTGSEASGLIKLDNTGNIFIVGSFDSSTDFDPSAAVVNITSVSIGTFVAKYK